MIGADQSIPVDLHIQDRTWPHGSYWTGKPNGVDPNPVGFTALELQGMRFPPIKYVVTGYIVEGLTLLAGRPKRGKSWLLLHAAIAVARGGYTLGDVKCVEGDVLYCALEDNNRRLQSRMQKLLPAFAQEWPERLLFLTEMPRLKDGGIDLGSRLITSS